MTEIAQAFAGATGQNYGDEPHTPDFQMDDVLREADRIRTRNAAHALVEAEQRPPQELPDVFTLADFLAIPDEDTPYLIDEVMPTGTHGIIAAQYKAGKTTLLGNLIRALVDGHDFLGRYTVNRQSTVTLIDNELDPRTLRRWLRAQGIQNVHAVRIVSLRGKVAAFDLLSEDTRAKWAQLLHTPGVVLFDCLRPVLDALGLDENRDAGRFLVAFDALLEEASATEAMIVHHMGHNGERSRGDSRLQDWPDTTWKLVREDPDDPSSARYFTAFGRDVNVPEASLTYDEDTRRLTIGEGSRKDHRDADQTAALLPQVIEFVRINPGTSGTGIESLPGGAAGIRKARKAAVSQGLIIETERQGKGGGKAYYPPGTANPV